MNPGASPVGSAYRTQEIDLVDEASGHRFLVEVETPNRYDHDASRRFPLVVCLDGLWTYGVVRDAFRILPLSKELPEAVVVGPQALRDEIASSLKAAAANYQRA